MTRKKVEISCFVAKKKLIHLSEEIEYKLMNIVTKGQRDIVEF